MTNWDERAGMPGLSAVLTTRWTTEQRASVDRLQQELVAERLASVRGGVALDVGCGTGRLISALGRCCECVYGVDASSAMIRRAVRECRGQPAQFVSARAEHLPFPEACFDVALAFCVFQHILDDTVYCRAAAEVCRVLRPAGMALLADGTAESKPVAQRSPIVFRTWSRYSEPWMRDLRLIGCERLVCVEDEYVVTLWRKHAAN